MTDAYNAGRAAGINRDVLPGPQNEQEAMVYEYEARIFDLEIAQAKAFSAGYESGLADGIRKAAARPS